MARGGVRAVAAAALRAGLIGVAAGGAAHHGHHLRRPRTGHGVRRWGRPVRRPLRRRRRGDGVGVGRRACLVDGIRVGARLRRAVQGRPRPSHLLRRMHDWRRRVRAPLGLVPRPEGLAAGGLRPQWRLRHAHRVGAQLLGVRRAAPPHRFQRRQRRTLLLRPRHRARRPLPTRRRGDVHVLLLLGRDRRARWHRGAVPDVLEDALRGNVRPVARLRRRRAAVRLGVPEVVPRAPARRRRAARRACHRVQQREEYTRRRHTQARRRGRRRRRQGRRLVGVGVGLHHRRVPVADDEVQAGALGGDQPLGLGGVLRPQPQRSQPQDQPLRQRPGELARRDARLPPHRVAPRSLRPEAARHRHDASQRRLLLHRQPHRRSRRHEGGEAGVRGGGDLRHGGDVQPAVHLHGGAVPDGGAERGTGVHVAGVADGCHTGAAGSGARGACAVRAVRRVGPHRWVPGVLPAGDEEQAHVRHHGRTGGRGEERPKMISQIFDSCKG